MASFHHKGELLLNEVTHLKYRFYPNYIVDNPCSGILRVNISTWEIEIVEASGHPQNDRSASALVYKIKKEILASQVPPTIVYFVG